MCTAISDTTSIKGVGRGPRGWFPITQATVAYDHATHGEAEHALLLDFANYNLGTDARVALEMDLTSGKALLVQLRLTIERRPAGWLSSRRGQPACTRRKSRRGPLT